MHKHFRFVQVVGIGLVLSVGLYMTQQSGSQPTPVALNDPLTKLMVPEEEVDFTTIVASGVSKTSEQPVKLQTNHSSDILKAIDYQQNEYIAFADANDAFYPAWHLDNINAPQAWDISTGSPEIVIAVLDSGFALTHEDLQDGWFVNALETGTTSPGDYCWNGIATDKSANGCDDDQNGYTDDYLGWDFYSLDNYPQAGQTSPTGGGVSHGTLVAGLIGAASNNSVGIAGVDWSAKIMPLQVLSDEGSGYTSDIVAAIEYAVDNGANVINLSLGGAGHDPAMEAAISYAWSQDVVVVAASGNCASLSYSFCSLLEAPGYMTYPSLYSQALAVGAVSSSGQRASFSGYGPLLDVVAPGLAISRSTTWNSINGASSYAANISGTSFAAPIVSGVVGLLLSMDDSLTTSQVHSLIKSATNSSVFDAEYGYGSLQADRLLGLLGQLEDGSARSSSAAPALTISSGADPGEPIPVSGTLDMSIATYPGDQLSLYMRELNTGQEFSIDSQKTNSDGVAAISLPATELGAGAWQVIPSGLQLTGQQAVIYIAEDYSI